MGVYLTYVGSLNAERGPAMQLERHKIPDVHRRQQGAHPTLPRPDCTWEPRGYKTEVQETRGSSDFSTGFSKYQGVIAAGLTTSVSS